MTVSCHFHFNKFPFDFHECPIYFGTDVYSTDQMKFDEITVFHDYNKISKRQEPLFIDELALPFEFELKALPIKQKFLMGGFNYNISSAGILIRLRRNSLGQLLSGYYYPTTSFALLSMISFLINPDVVSSCFSLSKKYFISSIHFSFLLSDTERLKATERQKKGNRKAIERQQKAERENKAFGPFGF